MIGMSAEVALPGLHRLKSSLPARLQAAVDSTALIVEGEAKKNAPHDTGALRGSIFTITSKSNGYSTAMASAEALRPGSGQSIDLPALAPLTAYVVAGVRHALYQEFGSINNPPTYFMQRAAITALPIFRVRVADAVKESRR